MIRFTWFQFRVQAAVALAAFAAFAIILVVTGPHLANLYAGSAITGCHGGPCANAANTFLSRLTTTSPYPTVYMLGVGLILAAPAIIGIFWGAPLIARGLETRTFALAWTQSITRTRWLVVKIALTGLAALAVTEALSLMQAWWADPISKAIGIGGPYPYGSVFDQGPARSVHLRHQRHHPARLRGVRLRPRNRSRCPHPAYRARHGRHPGHHRRRPGRYAAVGPPTLPPARPDGRQRPVVLRVCGGERRHTSRQHRPRPARSLDPLQRTHQRGRAACQHDSRRLPADLADKGFRA